MADKEYQGMIEIPCLYCGGTGEVPASGGGTASCRYCEGDGFRNIGNMEALSIIDLQSDVTKCLHRLKKILDKLEIDDD